MSKHLPLKGTRGDDFFVFQQDEYSCGPASMATVAKIFDAGIDYDKIRAVLDPSWSDGTARDKMAALAELILPFETAGSDVYKGGVAIANVMMGGEGHYVVLLAREADEVVYYDPYNHELVVDDIKKIDWRAGDGTKHWSIEFAPIEGNSIAKWLDYAEPKPATPAPRPAGPSVQPPTL